MQGVPPAAGTSGSRRSEFERRLAAAARPGDEPTTVATQGVWFGGGFAAALPQRFEEWSWSGDGEVTLAVHSGAGTVDALIYAEPSTGADLSPSRETDRFHRTTVPSLASAWRLAIPDLESLGAFELLARESGAALTDVQRALNLIRTRTLGRGLGFEGDTKKFTGWRWVGRNPQGVFLRLGQLRGHWGPVGSMEETVAQVLEALADRSPAFADLLAWSGQPPRTGLPSTPAYLVLVHADLGLDQSLHLAILCRLTPECPVAEDLARFVSSLRVAAGSSSRQSDPSSGQGFDALIRRAGLVIVPRGLVPTDEEVLAALPEAELVSEESSPALAGETPPQGEPDPGTGAGTMSQPDPTLQIPAGANPGENP